MRTRHVCRIVIQVANGGDDDGEDVGKGVDTVGHGREMMPKRVKRRVFEGRRGGPWIREEAGK